MITVMISGTLAKQPEQRISKTGNPFTLASIRIPTGEGDLFASITAFSELAPTLAGLQRGDPVTVVGQGKVSNYTGKDGEHRAGLSVTASRIIALADHQAPPKPPKPKADGQGRKAQRSFTEYTQPDEREYSADHDDAIPF